MSKKKLPAKPKQSLGDLAHAVVAGALDSVPVVGGMASSLFQHFISPPLQKRQEEWMEQLGEELAELHVAEKISLDDLQSDKGFIDTVMQASHAAMRNSQQEKLEALKNAVLNSASSDRPDDADRQMFLSLVDRFTTWHIRLLKLFVNPRQWFQDNGKKVNLDVMMGSLTQVIDAAYPELRGRREFYDTVWQELHSARLTNTDGLHTMMSGRGLMESRVSERGQRFLSFIAPPAG